MNPRRIGAEKDLMGKGSTIQKELGRKFVLLVFALQARPRFLDAIRRCTVDVEGERRYRGSDCARIKYSSPTSVRGTPVGTSKRVRCARRLARTINARNRSSRPLESRTIDRYSRRESRRRMSIDRRSPCYTVSRVPISTVLECARMHSRATTS